MTAPKLEWKTQQDGTVLSARRGSLPMGFVVERTDGTCAWQFELRGSARGLKGYGDCASLEAGRRALTRAWRIWCERAGLTSV